MAELRGRMMAMPTTWVMVTAVLGGQVARAGVVLSRLFMFRLN